MEFSELLGLDHILHIEASNVVNSRLGMSTFGPKLETYCNHDLKGTLVPVVIQLGSHHTQTHIYNSTHIHTQSRISHTHSQTHFT